MRSITITFWVHRSQIISGTITRRRPSMLRRSCAALAARAPGRARRAGRLSNSATTSRGFRRRRRRQARSTQRRPACASAFRSSSITSSMPGRSTFTATSRPSFSVGEVHLRDRGAGHRLGAEAGEDLVDRPAEGLLHQRARPAPPGRAARGPAAGRAPRRSRRQQVAPRRQHLAELDEDRPEPLQAPGAGARRAAGRGAGPRQHAHQRAPSAGGS